MKSSAFTVMICTISSVAALAAAFAIPVGTSPRLLSMKTDSSPAGLKEKGEKRQKKPWEFGRFVKTASFYNVFRPKLPFLTSSNAESRKFSPGEVLWQAPTSLSSATTSTTQGKNADAKQSRNKNASSVQWGPLDDVVMGGASKSELEPGMAFDGIWKGFISTANNGGFAGIRTKMFQPAFDLSSCRGLLLKVKGDGQRYKFIIRDDEDWNGVAWSSSFDTKKDGKIVAVKIPFASFKPTRFARVLPNYGPYNSANMLGMQFSLSKFEYDGGLNPSFKEGPFQLVVDSVSTF